MSLFSKFISSLSLLFDFGHLTSSTWRRRLFGFSSALARLFLRLVKGLAALEDHSSAGGCLAWTFTCSFSLYRSFVGRGKSSAYAGVSVKPPSPLDSGPAAGGCSRLQASLRRCWESAHWPLGEAEAAGRGLS